MTQRKQEPNASSERGSDVGQHSFDAQSETSASLHAVDSSTQDEQRTFSATLLTLLKRLFMGALVWAGVAVFVVLSAFPYGGGDRNAIHLLQLVSIAVPIWVLIPFFKYLLDKLAHRKGSTLDPDKR